MDEYSEPEDDIAAQMGFSSFGTQPQNKRRKIEPETTSQHTAVPPPDRAATVKEARSMEPIPSATAEPDLRAYRSGVRNERGDMVYFMPSFIEDPWKHLRKDQGR